MKTIQILLVAFFATTQVQAQGIMLAGGAVAEEPSFSPSDVPNLKAWYDANDMNGDGSSPSTPPATWVDKSASGFDLAKNGNPVFSTLNGKDVVYFDGAGDFFESTDNKSVWTFLHDATDNTIFIVMNSDVNNEISPIISTQRATSADIGLFLANEDRASSGRDQQVFLTIAKGESGVLTANVDLINGTMPTDDYYLFRLEKDLDNPIFNSKVIVYRDNIEVTNTNVYNDPPSPAEPSYNFRLASSYNAGLPDFTGYIAEVVIYDRLLTTQEITNVENYLSTKYGL